MLLRSKNSCLIVITTAGRAESYRAQGPPPIAVVRRTAKMGSTLLNLRRIAMSTHNEGKDVKGRSWDQVTNGTTRAGTMGAGSTGEVGASAEGKDPAQRQGDGAMQQSGQGSAAGRTDDLLAGGSNDEQSDRGFQGGGNRQSGPTGNRQNEADAADAKDDEYDQGTARRKP